MREQGEYQGAAGVVDNPLCPWEAGGMPKRGSGRFPTRFQNFTMVVLRQCKGGAAAVCACALRNIRAFSYKNYGEIAINHGTTQT
jgi:hypothetical protein